MSDALRESLSQTIGTGLLSRAGDTSPSAMLQTTFMEPLFFGAYFDLLSAEHLPASDICASRVATQGAVDWLGRRLSGQSLPSTTRQVLQDDGSPPLISTLSADFYSPTEIARWNRWLDMEPDNAMSLSGLQADELNQETYKVQRALTELELSAPELYAEIVIITREILVLRPDGAQHMSFCGASSFALWGASAFNQLEHQHWSDYFKTLVHESAHSLLFALARDQPLVLNDSSQRYGSPLRDDLRPMDGIFHAAFVSAREAYALDKYLDFLDLQNDAESKACIHKLEPELSASVRAFWDCFDEINENGLLSPLGQEILNDTTAWVSSCFQVETVGTG
jgi:HEXXH motif-containing protein